LREERERERRERERGERGEREKRERGDSLSFMMPRWSPAAAASSVQQRTVAVAVT
jgi:hypothetical protein